MNSKEKKLFGTDGIRGRANKYPVTPEIALKVGQALGTLLKQKYPDSDQHTVLIGKDTRLSGYMLEQALASGLNSVGVFVQLTGPLPTPGIGFLAQNMRVSAGVVISASHNPYYDNGIKIFFKDGFKISKRDEEEIERLVFLEDSLSYNKELGRTKRIADAIGRYIVFVKHAFPKDKTLKGLKMVLDCANGSCYKVAPAIFEELGAKLVTLNDKPNGFNINDQAGALYPEKMAQMVLQEKADLGLSVDGDGDRLIMVDEKGRILNGDYILGICALYLASENKLKKKKVVSTYLSNTGMEESLAEYGISFEKTAVGDRNVVQKMKEEGIDLGGESSGHIIFLNNSTTGDACIAGLNVLACMVKTGKSLSQLRDQIKEKPQVSMGLKVSQKPALESLRGYEELIKAVNKDLSKEGRLLVRYSGTEDLVRIFVEGKELVHIQKQAEKIKDFLQKELS